ncbi:MAG: peptide chain release factor N(5)-glutamine methyltransferase, partial [Anaerolineae bacterium]|nr:peptide chain release factor N(5)-glutamine methyltransferase [Anaerolineae bacterium]
MMTIRTALQSAYEQLASTSSTPRLDAQVLLCRVLDVEKTYLVAYDERELSPAQEAEFTALMARRITGEPIAYILGKAAFYDLEFAVSPAVLIPRPETEHLIEAALDWGKGRSGLIVADIGTGSGAIAVTVA